MESKISIKLWDITIYRRFTWRWWKDIYKFIFGGWFYDLKTYWHRAKYGWAPSDTWSLDYYLDGVLAGALHHLAENNHGAPVGYSFREGVTYDTPTDFEQWNADLKRWAEAFRVMHEQPWYNEKYSFEDMNRMESEARESMNVALAEMTFWWEALWD